MRYQPNSIKRLAATNVSNLALLSLLALSLLISPICALSFHTGGARTSAAIQRSPTSLAGTVSSIYSDYGGRNSLLRKRSIIHGGRGRATSGAHRYDRHGTICSMSTPIASTMAHADLAVRLDQPVLYRPAQCNSATNYMIKSILAILVSDVFKTACVAFLIAFLITFASKSSKQFVKVIQPIRNTFTHFTRLIKGKFSRFNDLFDQEEEGSPMVFEGEGGDGWGVCTLASVQKLGRSQYTEYEFKLPRQDHVLQLALGQQLTLCCLDSADNVTKKNHYVYSKKSKKGKRKGHFSIVAKKYVPEDKTEMKKRRARGEGSFEQVLATELGVGDEIALQPGPRTLDYKGEYLPVTDMVYFAAGGGIVPVMEQVKSVLPPGSSSLKGVSVIWANSDDKDFDIALSTLEDEYFKYSTKLAVSCIVERESKLKGNVEVDEAVPDFHPGTMAVVSGPESFTIEAIAILLNKGYPDNCICVLPA